MIPAHTLHTTTRMAIRERLRKAFKSNASSTSSDSTSTTGKGTKTWPSNVYAPGEAMPRPKYRQPPKKEHTEKLEAFSFGAAWRRRSFVSEYSPHGSRMPSRRASLISRASFGGRSRKSMGDDKSSSRQGDQAGNPNRRSLTRKSEDGRGLESREGSLKSLDVDNNTSAISSNNEQRRFKEPHGAAIPTRLSVEVENEGDDDVTNVGLSRVNSNTAALPFPPPTATTMSETSPRKSTQQRYEKGTTIAHDHQPFTEEDLALAMSRSHLVVPTRS